MPNIKDIATSSATFWLILLWDRQTKRHSTECITLFQSYTCTVIRTK